MHDFIKNNHLVELLTTSRVSFITFVFICSWKPELNFLQILYIPTLHSGTRGVLDPA